MDFGPRTPRGPFRTIPARGRPVCFASVPSAPQAGRFFLAGRRRMHGAVAGLLNLDVSRFRHDGGSAPVTQRLEHFASESKLSTGRASYWRTERQYTTDIKKRRPRWASAEVEQLKSMADAGICAKTIARALGTRTDRAVHEKIRLSSGPSILESRKRALEKRLPPLNELAAEYGAGSSIRVLSDKYGVYRQFIIGRLKDHGCKMRTAKEALLLANGGPSKKKRRAQ